jgi:micrococcal nuclease
LKVLGVLLGGFALAAATGVAWYKNPGLGLEAAVGQGQALLGGKKPATEESNDVPTEEVALVVRVVDGDTLVVSVAGKEERVRMLNVNTPESVHSNAKQNLPIGKEASQFLRDRIEGRQVRLLGEKEDRYGRRLATVFSEGENVNLELVRRGWSPYITAYGKAGDWHDEFEDAEADARREKLGVWGDPEWLARLAEGKLSDE